jgi:hypothetical protein
VRVTGIRTGTKDGSTWKTKEEEEEEEEEGCIRTGSYRGIRRI